MSFSGKVVLVTGAASGIGRGIALHMSSLSAKLSLIDIDEIGLEETAKTCGTQELLITRVDLTEDKQIEDLIRRTVERFGRLDVVVNCAGVYCFDNLFTENLLQNFDKVLAINLRSIIAMCHYSAPALIETKGCIINISSMYSTIITDNALCYLASKAGVNHFSRAIAIELASKGVRVNCILPGLVKTNLLRNVTGISLEESDDAYDNLKIYVPLGEISSPGEIADAVVFLASDKASHITGVCLPVDCGTSIASPLSVLET